MADTNNSTHIEILKNQNDIKIEKPHIPKVVKIANTFNKMTVDNAAPPPQLSDDQALKYLRQMSDGVHVNELRGISSERVQKLLENSDLNDAQKARILHADFHTRHKGHEAMHAEMALVMISILIIGQVVLFQLKRRKPKIYNTLTLFLLWITPFIASIYYNWFRFVIVWSIFSLITGLPIRKAVWTKQLLPETPRLVYRIFLFMFRISLTVGTVGYICFLFTMLGFNMMFLISPEIAFDFSFLCLWYGFYFGVVIRDFSDLCATSIAVKGKFYTEKDDAAYNGKRNKLPSKKLDKNTCPLCAQKMSSNDFFNSVNQNSMDTRLENIDLDETDFLLQNSQTSSDDEQKIKLSCGHEFHEYCIRGWVILGKQQTCPYCSEKVDFKLLGNHPWEKYNRMYAQLLEWLRYLVAWQPILLLFIHGVTWLMGLE